MEDVADSSDAEEVMVAESLEDSVEDSVAVSAFSVVLACVASSDGVASALFEPSASEYQSNSRS